MTVSLYRYQREVIDKLDSGSILCGGVGSGKSRTSLAYYFVKECGGELEEEFKLMTHPKDLYIITTARKRDTLEWEKELVPFLLSTNREISICNVKVVIDSWNNIGKYVDAQDSFFIFDEQRLVGSGAWVKSFLKIAKSNRWILLSATPGDTWMDYIPVFVANGFYKNRTEFIRRHVVYSRFAKYPKVDHYVECDRLEKLRRKIVVDMKYYKPSQQHHVNVTVGYDEDLMKRVTKDRWNIFKDKPIKDASELCFTMRKISNMSDERIDAIFELVKEHPKAIIFYNFDYELEMLRELGKNIDIETREWNGHKHEAVPIGDRWLYLVQYTAGAEGWNCVTTDTIIFYSQNYSYKIMQQAAGRIDRLNTPYSDLWYFHLITDSAIDKAISASLSKKKNFNESCFSFDASR